MTTQPCRGSGRIRRLAPLAVAAAVAALLLAGCPQQPSKADPPVYPGFVVLGDSISMGIQDNGLVARSQLTSYPCLIASRMGRGASFQQPVVSEPGIGVPPCAGPMTLQGGSVHVDLLTYPLDMGALMQTVVGRLTNASLPRPYDNLAVCGARLRDLRGTTGYADSGDDNYFFDVVLRNDPAFSPGFGGTTMVQQAVSLRPEVILLWIGSNDVLRYVLWGGENEGLISDPDDFAAEYAAVLDALAPTGAVIVAANIQEYLPYAYALDRIFVDGEPRLFDPARLEPVDFDPTEGVTYISLLLGETPSAHLTLQAALDYAATGRGIADSLTADQRALLAAKGVTLGAGVGQSLGPEVCITDAEEQRGKAAVAALNSRITAIASARAIPVVDINGLLKPGGLPAGVNASLDYVLVARDTTVFSLDGVHPSDLGHALIANAFIAALNSELGLSIPAVDVPGHAGQYSGLSLKAGVLRALQGTRGF